jgi:hypothetical protein
MTFFSSAHVERSALRQCVADEMPRLFGVYPYKASKEEHPIAE